MKKIFFILIILSVLFSSGCGSFKKTSLNFAVEMNDHAAAAYVAEANKLYGKYGIKVGAFYQYATGMELAAALSRGDINVGYVCVIPAIIAYSRGVPIKIVSLTHEYGYELITSKDIANVEDLNGAEVTCPGAGSAANFVMRLIEEKYDVKFKVLRTKPMEEITLMEKGAVKAAFVPEHYASILHSKGFKLLLRSQDVFPQMPGSCVVVKDNIINKNPKIVRNIIKVTNIATAFVNSNRSKAVEIVANHLNCDDSTIRYSMNNLLYTTKINKSAIQKEIDILAKWGYIKKFNVDEILWKEN